MEGYWRRIRDNYTTQIILGVLGIPIGIAVGCMDTVFGKVLLYLSALRDLHPVYFIPFLPLAGIVIAYTYLRFGGKSSRGMNLVFEVGHGEGNVIPLRLIPFVMCGTWMTHLFGGSAGREGVAVQIGATVSHWVGRRIPIKNASRIFLVVGMAAGFAGLFRTPVAAVLFAMEVLVAGELKYDALFPAMTAAFAASTTSRILGLQKFTFLLETSIDPDPKTVCSLLLLGVIFGVTGGAFAWILKCTKQFAARKIPGPVLRIALAGVGLSLLLLLFWDGRYTGLGTNLIEASFYGGTIYPWDWGLKFALTVLTLAVGYQGGEVTPLFSIGASLGCVLGAVLRMPPELAAALGYAAVFGSATNTFFAPMLIGAEVFGLRYLPYFFVVCAVSYAFNMNKSIYTSQRKSSGTGNF